MFGDTRTSTLYSFRTDSNHKVFTNADKSAVFGISGGKCTSLIAVLRASTVEDLPDMTSYLADNEYVASTDGSGEATADAIMLTHDKRLIYIAEDTTVLVSNSETFAAIGSGAEFVHGFLKGREMLAPLTIEDIKQAIVAVSNARPAEVGGTISVGTTNYVPPAVEDIA